MMNAKRTKLLIDLLLGIGLLLLMSYQVVGEAGHEWTGISMTVLMILHQVLNRRWIASLFRGKYTLLRTVQTFINIALVVCFILTALCGINMSVHAVPFLSEFLRASLGRRLHLTLSHWCFVLMGLHLGLHERRRQFKYPPDRLVRFHSGGRGRAVAVPQKQLS